MIEIHWIFILMIFIAGGCLGIFIIALMASRRMAELVLGNRKLQRERDEALRFDVRNAKNYNEIQKLLEDEQ